MIRIKIISVVVLTIVLLFLIGSCVGLRSEQAEGSRYPDSQLESEVSKETISEDISHETEKPYKETITPDNPGVIDPSETDTSVSAETTLPQAGTDTTIPEITPPPDSQPSEPQGETRPLEDGETERDS